MSQRNRAKNRKNSIFYWKEKSSNDNIIKYHTPKKMMIVSVLQWLLILVSVSTVIASKARPPQYFDTQLVDHDHDSDGLFWSQRYYSFGDHFRGPGFPIFLVMGGEGNIEPSTGIFYPFVTDHLAKEFGGFVLEAEHRFYGVSLPLYDFREQSPDPRIKLLTPRQTLQDSMRLVRYTQAKLGCSFDRKSPNYCPVITVGGSYPGWLSAMARLVFPDIVDMAYAASAPMKFYSQQVRPEEYYNHISHVAEMTQPGCLAAVQHALQGVQTFVESVPLTDLEAITPRLGFCPDTLPEYMLLSSDVFLDEVFMMIGYTFANLNMANYPPSNNTGLYRACSIYMNPESDPIEITRSFLTTFLPLSPLDCINVRSQLPSGVHATISGGDWSGVGDGTSGESWDFQTCTLLVEAIGFSETSMFPPRSWSLEWMTEHCNRRFGVTPQPYQLLNEWGWDDLIKANASRILFTNGKKDGWFVGGIQESLSDTLLVVNFENGAHHSDLSGQGPSVADTDDIRAGFVTITGILGTWLNDLPAKPQWIAR